MAEPGVARDKQPGPSPSQTEPLGILRNVPGQQAAAPIEDEDDDENDYDWLPSLRQLAFTLAAGAPARSRR